MRECITCESVARAALGEPAKRQGAELFYRCPNPELHKNGDAHPSLQVNTRKNAWGCFVCDQHGESGWTLAAFLTGLSRDDRPAVAAWLSKHDLLADGAAPQGQIEAEYNYADESGNLLYQVVRKEGKKFSQRRPDGKGGWVWNLNGTRRVLYRLPEVRKAQAVLLTEGEKDADTAHRLDLTATCNSGGAGKWQPEYSESLRGKRVAIICDADPPGLIHGRDVARSLVGVAESVRLIEALPGVSYKGDLTDYIEAGGTRDDLVSIIKSTPKLTRADVQRWAPAVPEGGFHLTSLRDLMGEPEEKVSWLLEGILPGGGLSLLAAKPKTGKSTLARCLALAVAGGSDFLGRPTLAGSVIYLALEEKRSEVRSHFRAMGATGEEEIFVHAAHAPADALPAIRQEMNARKPALLIIDPLLRFTRVKDGNDYAQVTLALEPLLVLARESGAHVLLVHHLGKGERAEATDGILGSTALFAAVDTALIMKRSEKYRTIQSRQRYGEDLAETVLMFDPDRKTLSLGAEKCEAEASAVSEEILRFLDGAASWKTEPEITEAVEGKTRIVRQALRDLVKSGKVGRDGGGKRGDPYTYSKSLFSCSHIYAGTREQEMQKPADTRINTERNLVPASEQQSFLAPENKEATKAPDLPPEAGPDAMEV